MRKSFTTRVRALGRMVSYATVEANKLGLNEIERLLGAAVLALSDRSGKVEAPTIAPRRRRSVG